MSGSITSVPPGAAEHELANLAADLRVAVGRLARRLRQQADPALSPSMLSALWTIERLGPITMGDLAAAEHVQPPTVTRVVARLEEAELIRRVQDGEDRRVSRVELSPAGRTMVGRVRTRRTQFLARRLAGLDEDDRAVLRRAAGLLERMTREGP